MINTTKEIIVDNTFEESFMIDDVHKVFTKIVVDTSKPMFKKWVDKEELVELIERVCLETGAEITKEHLLSELGVNHG